MKEQVFRSRPGAALRRHKAKTKFSANWLRDFEAKQDEVSEAHGCRVGPTRYSHARSKPLMVEPGEEFPRQWSQPKKGGAR